MESVLVVVALVVVVVELSVGGVELSCVVELCCVESVGVVGGSCGQGLGFSSMYLDLGL